MMKNLMPPSFPFTSPLRNAAIRNPGADTSSSEMNSIRRSPRGRHQQAAEERGHQQEVELALVEAAFADVPQRQGQHDDRDDAEEALEQQREVVHHVVAAERDTGAAGDEGQHRDERGHRADERDRHPEPGVTTGQEGVDHEHGEHRDRHHDGRRDRVEVAAAHATQPPSNGNETIASTVLPVISKMIPGNSPRTTTSARSGVHAEPLHPQDVAEPARLPLLGQGAHVHALEHPQEVARGEHGPDAAHHHEHAELRRRQGRVRLERGQQRHHLAPEPGQPGQARATRSPRTRRCPRAWASPRPCRHRSRRSRACGSGRRSTRRRRTASR